MIEATPSRRAASIDGALVFLIALILVPMSLFYAGPDYMNADTPLLAMMSIQRPTLFIWGQNRFLNIVPAITSPVRWPDANLAVQLMLFGGGFIGLLALGGRVLARVVLRSGRRLDAWLCFAALLFVFFAVASRYAIHAYVSEGQPYGLSGLLMGFGLLVLLEKKPPGRFSWIGAVAAMLIAGGLNPSLMLFTVPACGLAFLFWPEMRKRAVQAGTLSAAACGFWLFLGRLYPGPNTYGEFDPARIGSNLEGAWRALSLGLDAGAVLAGLGLAAMAALAVLLRPGSKEQPRWLLVSFCAAFALGWFLLFAQNAWVIMNGWHFRYFYPVTLAVVVLIAVPVVALATRLGDRARAGLAVTLLLACPALLATPWRPIDAFPVFARVAGPVAEAERQGIRIVAGSYWQVWPAVFLLNRKGPAFGIEEERAIGNRRNLLRAMQRMEEAGQSVRSLCVEASADRCLGQAAMVTGRSWRTAEGNCGPGCLIIEAEAPR